MLKHRGTSLTSKAAGGSPLSPKSRENKTVVKLLAFSLVLIFGLEITKSLSKLSYDSDLVSLANDITGFSTSTSGSNVQKDEERGLSPFFSIEPLTKSLHPHHKLWIEMNEKEQDAAMDRVGEVIRKYAAIIYPEGKSLGRLKSVKQGDCTFEPDIGRNGHTLCGPKPQEPCFFISFGINDDPSFDVEVADTWKCRGYAGDPTVRHPSKIHELVTFHNVAATTLQDNEERLINKGGAEEWWVTSFPKLRYFLGLEKIDLLKIDCEGCEVALARDMLREDPEFLLKVDQISIETHVTKTWMTTREHVYYFGLMLVLLEEAGFKMEWSSIFGCSKRHEITGCMPEFEKYGWPCGYEDWPNHPNVVLGRSCQEFTWKRYPLSGASSSKQ